MEIDKIKVFESLLESAILGVFMVRVLKPKFKAGLTILIWMGYILFMDVFSWSFDETMVSLLNRAGIHIFDERRIFRLICMELGTMASIMALYKEPIWKKLLVGGEILLTVFVLEAVGSVIVYASEGHASIQASSEEQYVLRTAAPMWFSSFSIIVMTLQTRHDRKENFLIVLMQLLLLICEMSFAFILFLGARSFAVKHIIEINILVYLPTIAVNYLSSLVLQHLSRLRERETRLAFAEEMGEKEYAYYQLALKNENTLREMRHEIANQLQIIEALFQMGEEERARKIAENLTNRFRTAVRMQYCDNQIVNIILSIKSDESNSKGVLLQNKVMPVLGKMKIEDMDLSMVLTNLLDNAIRACNETESSEKAALCEIGCKQGRLVIRVSNNTDIKAENEGSVELKTTKEDKFRHGVGLALVGKVVEKYDGSFDIKLDEERFVATVII